MPLTNSGTIDLNAIHVEAGGASGTSVSINDADIRGLLRPIPTSGSEVSFSDYYGASASVFDASIDFPIAGRWENSSYAGDGGGTGYDMSSSNWNATSSSQGYGGTDCYVFGSTLLVPGATYQCEWNVGMSGDYCFIAICGGDGTPGFPTNNQIYSGRGYERISNLFGYSYNDGYYKRNDDGTYGSFNGSGGSGWKSASGTFQFTNTAGTSHKHFGMFYAGGANSGYPGNVYWAQFRTYKMIITEV